MESRGAVSLRGGVVGLLAAMMQLASCTGVYDPGTAGSGSPDSSTISIPSDHLAASARQINLALNDSVFIEGELTTAVPLQVWDLGALPARTRLTVDVQGQGRDLAMGLFDEEFQILLLNNNRINSIDPYAVYLSELEQSRIYLAISGADSHVVTGAYTMTISLTANQQPLPTQTQAVVLVFGGASGVDIGNYHVGTVPAFDAADLDPTWGDHTGEMKQLVMNNLREVYTGLNVQFYFDEDGNLPTDNVLSRVYFGAHDANNVGLAANVDYGNNYQQQACIVYTQNFSKYAGYGYSYQDIAQGFASVAAHELGHLLGCNHSDLPADVMNVSPTVADLLAPKYFVESAALDSAVFPTGQQDGGWLVYRAVGGDWDEFQQARSVRASHYQPATPQYAFYPTIGQQRVHIADFARSYFSQSAPHEDH